MLAPAVGRIIGYDMQTADPLDKARRVETYALLLADPLAFVSKERYVLADTDPLRNGWYDCTAVNSEGIGTWVRRRAGSGSTTVGPAGPVGPAGAVGPRGNNGESGATGPAGDLGPQGPAGTTGPTGPAGPAGARGAVGATGLTGEQGSSGDLGPAGSAGPRGLPGSRILHFAANPGTTDGMLADMAINDNTGDYFEKTTDTVWTLRGNIKGPAGAAGPAGPQGPAGPAGSAGSGTGTSSGTGGHVIKKDGNVLPAQANLDFIGSNITVTNNATNGSTEIRVAGAKVAWDYVLGNTSNPPPIDFLYTTVITKVAKTSGIVSGSYAVGNGSPQPFVFTNGADTRTITIPAGSTLTITALNFSNGTPNGTLFFEATQ